MRYWRELLLLGLLLVGLEVAVDGVSLVFRELMRALGNRGAGPEATVGGIRLALGLMLAAVGTGGLATSVWVRTVRRRIVTGKRCPACENDTVRIRRRRRDRLLGWLLRTKLQRRICSKCGWRGLTVA